MLAFLVFLGRRHESLVIVKNPERRVVGGITYKLFPDAASAGFCEIVFCAVASSDQVKGFGSYLMCHLKEHIRRSFGASVQHFLTYADNYAVGYFRKQGFTANVTLERERWAGKIKDYDGGTLMQCTLVPSVNYLEWYGMVWEQQVAMARHLHERTGMGRVYFGLKFDSNEKWGPLEIPGVAEAGWTEEMSAASSAASVNATSSRIRLAELLRPLLSSLQSHPASWPFRQPVDVRDVPDYLTVITHPMDLASMQARLESSTKPIPTSSPTSPTPYDTIDAFIGDFNQVITNCRMYNDADTTYCKNATILERFFNEKIKGLKLQLQQHP